MSIDVIIPDGGYTLDPSFNKTEQVFSLHGA